MTKKIFKFTAILICFLFLVGCGDVSQPENDAIKRVDEESVADENDVVDWAMYENNEFNFSFEYPAHWIHRESWLDSQINMILHIADENFMGGPGDQTPLSLSVSTYAKETYEKPKFIDYGDMVSVLEPTEVGKIFVSNIAADKERYENGAPEWSKDIVYLLELEKDEHVYVFEFQYYIAGCKGRYTPGIEQEECFEQMEVFEQENIDLIDKIISSFKFLG